MKNNTGILDCVSKLVTFMFNNETFTVDIKEGDLHDSWNSIVDKNGVVWDFNFAWEDTNLLPKPSLTIYSLLTDTDGTTSTNWSDDTSIDLGKPNKDVFFKEERFGYIFDEESPIIARIYNGKDEEIHKTKSFNRACDKLHFAKKEDAKSYMVVLATKNNSTIRIDN